MGIEVKGVSKKFGQFVALDNINLKVEAGELVALLGPSGSGKTTLLRVIAGLEVPDAGTIHFHGEDASFSKIGERGVGFVFQHYALFRHMTVFENVAFGLRVKPKALKPREPEIRKRVSELLELVQIEWLAKRYPAQLSGGQRQRVAIARALAVEPKVLLLDEPFGALDAKVRQELRRWLRRLHDDIHVTSVFVTHDQEEALEVANRIVVINQGRVEQIGKPEEVYEHPATPFVYDFLGKVNFFQGRIKNGKMVLESEDIAIDEEVINDAQRAMLYIRPHHIDIDHKPRGEYHLRARVKHINRAGPLVKIELRTEWGELIHVEMSQERFRKLHLKRDIDVFAIPREMKIFPADEKAEVEN